MSFTSAPLFIFMKIHKRNYLPIFFSIGIFAVMLIVGSIVPKESIRDIIEKAGLWSIVLLIFLPMVCQCYSPAKRGTYRADPPEAGRQFQRRGE